MTELFRRGGTVDESQLRPTQTFTQAQMRDALQAMGYYFTTQGYKDFESGVELPTESREYLNAFTTALGINPGSEDWRTLADQLWYENAARNFVPGTSAEIELLLKQVEQRQTRRFDTLRNSVQARIDHRREFPL